MKRTDLALAAIVIAAAAVLAVNLRAAGPTAPVPGSISVFERAAGELEASTWLRDGRPGAARVVYAFMDPNCPFCHRFWSDARPWVDAGRVEIRHVLVGILGPTSLPKAAAILAAPDPAKAFAEHQRGRAGGVAPAATIDADIRRKLSANAQILQALGAQGTPVVVYRDSAGKLRAVQGAPGPAALEAILGPR